jgi:hypothetical protein
MARHKNPMKKKYQVGVLGLAGVLLVGAYFNKEILGLVDKVMPKGAQAGLGALAMQKNAAHMGALHMNPKHMGILSVDGKIVQNPGHMGALHLNPKHMGMVHGQYGAIGMDI